MSRAWGIIVPQHDLGTCDTTCSFCKLLAAPCSTAWASWISYKKDLESPTAPQPQPHQDGASQSPARTLGDDYLLHLRLQRPPVVLADLPVVVRHRQASTTLRSPNLLFSLRGAQTTSKCIRARFASMGQPARYSVLRLHSPQPACRWLHSRTT